MRRAWHAPALAAIASLALGLAACDESLQIENAATDPAELARYLPEDSGFVTTTDVAEARQELGLPDDADATPIEPSDLRDGDSPQSTLFALTSRSFPLVSMAYAENFNGKGASPLDGRLILAAAYNLADISIVSTAEPFPQVADKLRRDDYSLKRGLYIAGPETPEVSSPVVADGGAGRVVFSNSEGRARKTLRRIERRSVAGPLAEALNSVSGSIKVAMEPPSRLPRRSRCIEALAAAQSATGKGAIMALEIEGEKPNPDRFDPSKMRSLDTGTASVLVDALLVPFNIAKPKGEASEPIDGLIRDSATVKVPAGENFSFKDVPVPTPFDSYDCP
jgi:hypothetical protein